MGNKTLKLENLELKSFITNADKVRIQGGSDFAACFDDGSRFGGSCANTCGAMNTCQYSCGQNTCNGGPC